MKHLSPNKNMEEEEVNEKIKKIKKRLKQIKKNQIAKTKKKDKEKIEEKELYGKLNEFNKEFQTINNIRKKQKNV